MENEKKTEEGKKSEVATPNLNDGNQPEGLSLIERADALRKSLEESEKRITDKIAKFEKELAEKILSGRAEIVPSKSQQEKDKETAKSIAAGLI